MIPTAKEKSCGKCLTSEEGLRIIEEKEKKQQEKIKQKEERKAKREEKLKAKREKWASKRCEVVRKKPKEKQNREGSFGSEIDYSVMNCVILL